jgi:hypothetical protein
LNPERLLLLSFTCPVSRFTYAGHPSRGTLYEHTNDLHDAVRRIARIADRHGQPVSWVINDQEYLNREGLMPWLLDRREKGDSILVTMELTTSPPEVDKRDAEAVLRWIGDRTRQAGFVPDGLWSLKFFESDLQAILRLPAEEFSWARNLAGSCWHQEGIDDSTWLGCPFNPYYPALWNSKAPTPPGEEQPFLMLEWLTRDINAILHGGFPATFSLDPADSNRKDAGGFSCEADALRYSLALIDETARQVAFNPTVVVNINEEARHYQTEGHDKDFMLDGMFRHFAGIAASPPPGVAVRQAACRDVWREYRLRHPSTPQTIWLARDLDWREGELPGADRSYTGRPRGDLALLFQDASLQAGFLRSRGPLPAELFDYTTRAPGQDSNEPYPPKRLPPLQLRAREMDASRGEISVRLNVHAAEDAGLCPVMLWDAPVRGDEELIEAEGCLRTARPSPAGLFLLLHLRAGANEARVRLRRPG